MVKAVIFDFDGVIIDSLDPVHRIYRIIGREMKREIPKKKEKLGDSFGGDYKKLMKKVGIHTREDQEKAVGIFKKHSRVAYRKAKPFSGIQTIIRTLRKMGYKVGVVSNNYPEQIKTALERIGVGENIDAIVGINGSGKIKPDPDQLIECMKMLKSEPDETTYVGDMEDDIRAARAAGIKVIAVTYGWNSRRRLSRHKPDFVVKSPVEILDCVG